MRRRRGRAARRMGGRGKRRRGGPPETVGAGRGHRVPLPGRFAASYLAAALP